MITGGLDTAEPWQGRWAGGILVECVGNREESSRGSSNRNREPQNAVQNSGQRLNIFDDARPSRHQYKKVRMTNDKTTIDEYNKYDTAD